MANSTDQICNLTVMADEMRLGCAAPLHVLDSSDVSAELLDNLSVGLFTRRESRKSQSLPRPQWGITLRVRQACQRVVLSLPGET